MSNNIEWKMVKLGDVAEFLPTNTLSRDELNYSEGEYLNIHYGDVLIKFDSVTDVLNSEIPFVSLNKKFSDKSLLKNGDIVMADTAEDESVGKVTEIQNIDNCKVVSGLHTLCMRFQENLFAPKFAGYYLNSPAFHNLLLPYMHGTKVTSISKGDVKKIVFPIPYKNSSPDLETQKQIAQKLGDMDSLIVAKEKLLAKKRDLKVAAMQKLIKDEESENWKKVKLGDSCKIGDGLHGTPTDDDYGNCAFFINGNNLVNGSINITDGTDLVSESFYKKKKINFSNDTVFLSINGTIGNVALYSGEKIILGKSVAYFDILKNLETTFLYYVLQSDLAKKYFENLLTGSTIKNLGLTGLRELKIPIPYKNGTPDLNEQRRIASILSDMDCEIAAIEKEITKLQNLKTAMMQKMFCFEDSDSSSE